MLKLHVLQGELGDCRLLEYGTVTNPNFALIDGGPHAIYDHHLRPVLQELAPRGRGSTLSC